MHGLQARKEAHAAALQPQLQQEEDPASVPRVIPFEGLGYLVVFERLHDSNLASRPNVGF